METPSPLLSKEILDDDFSLRRAEIADIPKILEWEEQAKIASTGSGFTNKNEKHKSLEQIINDANYQVFIIEDNDNNDIGSTILRFKPTPETINDISSSATETENKSKIGLEEFRQIISGNTDQFHRAHINSMTISPEHRSKGIGSMVIDKISQYLKGAGFQYLSFDTGKENLAVIKMSVAKGITFYEGTPYPTGQTKLIGLKKL